MVALNLELLKGNFLKVVLDRKNDCLASTSSTRTLIAKSLWLCFVLKNVKVSQKKSLLSDQFWTKTHAVNS